MGEWHKATAQASNEDAVRALKDSWKEHDWETWARSTYGWTKCTAAEKSAVEAILAYSAASDPTLRSLHDIVTELEDGLRSIETSKYMLREDDRDVLIGVVNTADALVDAVNNLDAATQSLETESGHLTTALTKSSDDKTTDLKNAAVQTLKQISATSHTLDSARDGFTDLTEAMKSIETAATSLEDMAELQAGLAYRGTAPAVIMLFAIGGMFVTFGLSSLLKWIKESERAERLVESRNQRQTMTHLGSVLLANGLDPSAFLDRIQSSAPAPEESQGRSAQLPVSVTLAEITSMLRGK